MVTFYDSCLAFFTMDGIDKNPEIENRADGLVEMGGDSASWRDLGGKGWWESFKRVKKKKKLMKKTVTVYDKFSRLKDVLCSFLVQMKKKNNADLFGWMRLWAFIFKI